MIRTNNYQYIVNHFKRLVNSFCCTIFRYVFNNKISTKYISNPSAYMPL
nr:hypothetical protein LBZUJACN_LBZUJACN_CDS_0053 [Caudoviricetes sp.]CAI9751086.1 hypothetical protein MIHLRAQX_MIHLRAQX_CDS_0053 [Caudoviricetes sp.]